MRASLTQLRPHFFVSNIFFVFLWWYISSRQKCPPKTRATKLDVAVQSDVELFARKKTENVSDWQKARTRVNDRGCARTYIQSRFSYVGVAFGARIRVIQLAALVARAVSFSSRGGGRGGGGVGGGEGGGGGPQEVYRRYLCLVTLLFSLSLSLRLCRDHASSSSVLSLSSSVPFSRLALLYPSLAPSRSVAHREIYSRPCRADIYEQRKSFISAARRVVRARECSWNVPKGRALGVFHRADTSASRANQPQPAFLHFFWWPRCNRAAGSRSILYCFSFGRFSTFKSVFRS